MLNIAAAKFVWDFRIPSGVQQPNMLPQSANMIFPGVLFTL